MQVKLADVETILSPDFTSEIQQVGDERRNDWDQYVLSNNGSALYHQYAWRDVMSQVFKIDTYYLVALNLERIVGVLPLARLKSFIFGDFLVSLPYFNYGGALADSTEIEEQLRLYAEKLGEQLGVSHIEFRYMERVFPIGEVRKDKVSMMLALPDNSDELFNRLSSKLRSQIRRPKREGAKTQIGGKELLLSFYAVFSENIRDLGTPVYPLSFFSAILKSFPQSSRILVVHINNIPVAAAFLIGYNGTMEIPWASSLRDFNHLSINMQLYWEALKYSIDQGYRSFDFGRCTIDGGTYNFKKQWGAKPVQLYWYYWMNNGGNLPQINPRNPKYRIFISIWKQLPLWFVNWLGPKIIKHLP